MMLIGYIAAGALLGWGIGYTAADNKWPPEKAALSALPFALAAFIGLTYG